MAQSTIKGRATASTGDPEDLSASSVRTLLNTDQVTDSRTPLSHTHGNLTNDGKLGTTANLPLKTGTNGVVEAGAFGTSAGTFCEGNDARLSDDRDPNLHAASHAAAGSDPIAPSDIGAQSLFEIISVTASADTTLTASRGARYNILNFTGSALNITLPTTGLATSDVAIVSSPVMTGGGSLIIRRLNSDSSYTTLATITKSIGTNGETFRFVTVGPFSQDWRIDVVSNHGGTHASNGSDPLSLASSQITSGTLDVARLPVGTGSTQVAAGNHTHVVADVTGAAASGSITSSGLTQATARILGRTTASTGAVEEITIGSGLSLSAGELSATGGSGGGEVRSDFVSPYTYTGLADAGTSESTASWLIRRSEFDAGGSFVATLTASAVQWDDRLTASYA
jgi:hypothetical protein